MLRGYLAIVALVSATSAYRVPLVRMAAEPGMTVGEAKVRFYSEQGVGHALPMQTAAFASEIIQSTTFAMASPKFKYTRLFALGLETLCAEFLEPATLGGEAGADKIKKALCYAFEYDAKQIERDAEALRSAAEGKTEDEILEMADLKDECKYTYTYGAGLVTLMKMASVDPQAAIPKWSPENKGVLARDYAYYLVASSKMEQMKEMIAQMNAGAAKREAARLQEREKEKELRK